MRKALFAFFLVFASLFGLLQSAQAADPAAAKIFNTLQGTVTIDKGGAIHSQARSIYSLGGGQISFTGKKVSLLAADPPSFSAGCSGISWHFGGFAFISMDEIRQLVEAIAQASLGVAVDLAMQVLCPQCYAVMSKLREISNMMRNAAADACKVAKGLGRMLATQMGVTLPDERQSQCASSSSEDGQTANWLNGVAGALCRGMADAEKALTKVGDNVMKYLNGELTDPSKKPDQNLMNESGNLTYRSLSALGYNDGFVKDVMLSIIGMTVVHPVPNQDCNVAFKNLVGSAVPAGAPDIAASIVTTDSARTVKSSSGNPTPANAQAGTPASPPAGGSKVSTTICHAPPLLNGIENVTNMLLCGPNPGKNAERFANLYFKGDVSLLEKTSLGVVCVTANRANLDLSKDATNPFLYTCRQGTGDCREPKMQRASTLLSTDTANGFDGLVWMVADALYRGVASVANGEALSDDTKAILNGSGYPLYRLINMAAVYPGLAGELLGAYSSTIAMQYAMDTMEKVAALGAQPSIDLKLQGGLSHQTVTTTREQILQIIKNGQENKSQVLTRLSEKRALVETIMQVNRALQAEVISKGIGGNADLAISLRRQTAANPK